mgnify:CR=1 FL=1
MNLISTFIVWTWLLGTSLVLPTTLPAGGAQKSIIESRENHSGSPLIALKEFNLLSSATLNSFTLTKVKTGTPVKVIKVWDGDESGNWLLINVLKQDFNQLFNKRGWVHIGKYS